MTTPNTQEKTLAEAGEIAKKDIQIILDNKITIQGRHKDGFIVVNEHQLAQALTQSKLSGLKMALEALKKKHLEYLKRMNESGSEDEEYDWATAISGIQRGHDSIKAEITKLEEEVSN